MRKDPRFLYHTFEERYLMIRNMYLENKQTCNWNSTELRNELLFFCILLFFSVILNNIAHNESYLIL